MQTFTMKNWLGLTMGVLALSTASQAQSQRGKQDQIVSVSVREIADKNDQFVPLPAKNEKPTGKPSKPGDTAKPSPTPKPDSDSEDPTEPLPRRGGGGSSGGGLGDAIGGNLGTIITVGEKIWDFILTSKPGADYKAMRASVLPSNKSWSELTGWSKPRSKVYRVEFKNIFGQVAGSFDYRLTFIYGGGFRGQGKFIGQIAVVPGNIKLKTDRNLRFRAELLDPFNYGTEEDPLAAAELLIMWESPTTPRYEMHSVSYFLYGNGQVEDLTGGLPFKH